MTLGTGEIIYELVTGKKIGEKLFDLKRAGDAVLKEGNNFYILRLNALKQMPYYLSKNRAANTYTLFAKLSMTPHGPVLQDPIGSGKLTDELKTHLEILIPFFQTHFFMSLFPKN